LAEAERKQLAKWIVPRTEIALVRIEDGDSAGQFLFGAETVERTPEFYEKIKHLPTRPGHHSGACRAYVTMPPITSSYLGMINFPAWAKFTVLRNPLWKWFAMALLLGVGVWFTTVICQWGRRWDQRQTRGKGHWRIGMPVFAINTD
jgi:MscS family membrane protein